MKHFYDLTQQLRNGLTIPAPGVSVTVFNQGTLTKATLFKDDGITQTANPVASDANGRYDFYIANGRYDLAFSGPGLNSFTQLNVEITDAMDTTVLGQTPIAFTANNTHTGVETFSGALGIPNGTPVPALCTPGQFFYDTAGTALNVCTGVNTWTAITSTIGTGVANTWTALQTFNSGVTIASNAKFKGPNPYVDITAFGARTVNPGTTPAAVGLTANCTSGLNTVPISAASTFVNGDGVVLYGCGPTHSMTTPTGVVITPSVAFTGTGIRSNVPGPTGATTYNYQVIAVDRAGGMTAPSATASTTTGAVSLGSQTVNITSMSASGQVVTVTTAATHGFLVGCGIATCGRVDIVAANGLTDVTFAGTFQVSSAANGTTFTFSRPGSTTLGASASATGGTATYFNANKVAWNSVTGATYYAIYTDRAVGGTCKLIGLSEPNSSITNPLILSFEDFGSPMMDNQIFPAFLPASYSCASPPAATSDHLSTTITSGAGTTSLTLANTAGTTISGVTIRFDNGPAIKAAAASITNGYGTLTIPADGSGNVFVINSWTVIPGPSPVVMQEGPLWLNMPIEAPSSGNGGVKWIGDTMPQLGGGPSVTAWSSLPRITVNEAHPGLFFSGSQFAQHVSHVQVTSVAQNSGPLIIAEGGFNQTFDWLDFSSGAGTTNDYMSIMLECRGNTGQFCSNTVLDNIGFAPGQSNVPTPTFFCNQCGATVIPHSYSVHRGMQQNSGTVQLGVNGVAYINGGGTPLFTMSGTGSSAITLGQVSLDTIAQPAVAIIGSNQQAVQFVGPTAPSPSSGILPVSGNPSSISGMTDLRASTFFNTTGNFGNSNPAIGQNLTNIQNIYSAVSPIHSIFVNNLPMAAPTCSVSAGGGVTLGTYQFIIVPQWWNGLDGQISPLSNACTSSGGNQTITINWATIPGIPKGYDLYFCSSNGTTCTGGFNSSTSFGNPSTGTSVVWSVQGVGAGTSAGIPRGGPTMLMDGIKGLATPALTVAGTPFVSLTLPTISTHFNTSGDSITATSTATFLITVGTGAGTSTGAITLPAAPNGWNCELSNKNRAATIQQTGDTTTSATFTNFGTTFAATNWTNGDVLYGNCFPR